MGNQEVIKLRKNGYSLREISKSLEISIKKVRKACLGIHMSKKGLKRHSQLNGVTRKIVFKDELNEAKVRIISNLIFDGGVYKSREYHYTMMYVNSSKGLIRQFLQDMKTTYNIKPSTFDSFENYQRVTYYSKIIYIDLLKYCKSYSTSNNICSIPNEVMSGDEPYKVIILRSFWENEGSISFKGRLMADLKSLKVINQLSMLHDEFNLKHKIIRYRSNGWMHKLYLYKTKDNYVTFWRLGLFSKANVTRGYNRGMKKSDVLERYIQKKFRLKIN